VRKNHPILFSEKEDAEQYIKKHNLEKLDLCFKKTKYGDSSGYGLFKDKNPFTRIFRIDLPVNNLKTLITEMSKELSAEIKAGNESVEAEI
jgi:hypothetical protein